MYTKWVYNFYCNFFLLKKYFLFYSEKSNLEESTSQCNRKSSTNTHDSIIQDDSTAGTTTEKLSGRKVQIS